MQQGSAFFHSLAAFQNRSGWPAPWRRRWNCWAVVAAAVCWAALASPLLAQLEPPRRTAANPIGTISIRGTLRIAATDAAAEMVRVQLLLLSGEYVTSTHTRHTGEFEFSNVTSGTYTILIEQEGFEPIRENVDVRFDRNRRLQLYLREPAKRGVVPVPEASVSTRELALSPKAAEELRKGKERLFEKKDPAGGLKHFEKLAKEAPGFYEAHHYAGLALSNLKRMQEAEAALRKAIADSGERYAPSHFALASLLSNQKRYAEAEPLARKSVELDVDAWQGHFELARALDGQNRPNEALQSVQAVRKQHSDFPELLLLLVNIHIHRGDPNGVLAAADGYLKLRPDGPTSDRLRQTRQKVVESMASAGIKPAANQPPPQQ